MKKKSCVVIPCYKVRKKILSVLKNKNLNTIDKIVIVDDYCPENTGIFLKKLKSLIFDSEKSKFKPFQPFLYN